MKKYTYLGKVREGADPRKLIYISNGELTHGLVEVTHVMTGEVLYHSDNTFRKLYKEI